MNVTNMRLWAEEAQQSSDSIPWEHALDVWILMNGDPILSTVVKLGTKTTIGRRFASASLGAHEGNLGLNVWRMGKLAITRVDRHRPNELKLSRG